MFRTKRSRSFIPMLGRGGGIILELERGRKLYAIKSISLIGFVASYVSAGGA